MNVNDSNIIWDKVFEQIDLETIDIHSQLCEEVLLTMQKYLPLSNTKILEAGSGSGQLSANLASYGYDVTLLDKSQVALEVGKKIFSKYRLDGKFCSGDLFDLPFEDDSFDCVWNSGVLEHFDSIYISKALLEMKRVSKNMVITLVPNAGSLFYRLGKWYLEKENCWPYGHEEPKWTMKSYFENAGITVLDEFPIGDMIGIDWFRYLTMVNDELIDVIKQWYEEDFDRIHQFGYLLVTIGTIKPGFHKMKGVSVDYEKKCLFEIIEKEQVISNQRSVLKQMDLEASRLTGSILELSNSVKEISKTLNEEVTKKNLLEVELTECKKIIAEKEAAAREHKYTADYYYKSLLDLTSSRTGKLILTLTKVSSPKRVAVYVLRRVLPSKLKEILKNLYKKWSLGISTKAIRKELKQILLLNKEVKGIIIYPPTIDWNWMKQRPHHIIHKMAEKGYLVFFCTPNVRSDNINSFNKIDDRLYLCPSIEILYEIKEPILFIGWTEHYEQVFKFDRPLVIYDYLDDLSVSAEIVSEEKLRKHRFFLEKSDIVCVTADKLLTDARKIRSDVLYCPNATIFDKFAIGKAPEVPEDMITLVQKNKPIIGYYGALAKWFDYELIKYLASRNPDFEFVLIGPDYDQTLKPSGILEMDNVNYLGLKDFEELPVYLYYFDVATIPFKVNNITLATSPVKLFEYMSGGKPVVTTALPECKKYSIVLVSEDYHEFEINLNKALCLKKDPNYINDLLKEARANTWDARVEDIIKEIKKL